jgi:hypothetical protein
MEIEGRGGGIKRNLKIFFGGLDLASPPKGRV